MHHMSISILPGLVATIIAMPITNNDSKSITAAMFDHRTDATSESAPIQKRDAIHVTVNRESKGGRLPAEIELDPIRLTVGSVEVFGRKHFAVTYRDRAGHLLFRADPKSNLTIVAKGVLPTLTVQKSEDSSATSGASVTDVLNNRNTAQKENLKTTVPTAAPPATVKVLECQTKIVGCESAFGAHLNGNAGYARCLMSLEADSKLVAVRN